MTMTAEPCSSRPRPPRFSDYLELTKPRLESPIRPHRACRLRRRPARCTARRQLILVCVGTSLAAGGVAALNQWLESDTDALMKRTANRPIPTGKIRHGLRLRRRRPDVRRRAVHSLFRESAISAPAWRCSR